MGHRRLIAIALAAALLAGASPAPDYGAEPDWDGARNSVEAALKAKMIDPASTRISWPYSFAQGFTNYMFGEPRYGWWTCGRINSKGRSGAYVGDVWFTVLIKDGAIQSLDRGNTLEVTHASAHCEEAIKAGLFRPAPTVTIAAAPEMPREGLGIGFVPSPAGAVIQLVVAGSPAARAGLKVGQVIEAVNGAPIKGMARPEMIAAVRAQTPSVFLSIAGGGDVKVTRKPS
jgi:hypothetical protein